MNQVTHTSQKSPEIARNLSRSRKTKKPANPHQHWLCAVFTGGWGDRRDMPIGNVREKRHVSRPFAFEHGKEVVTVRHDPGLPPCYIKRNWILKISYVSSGLLTECLPHNLWVYTILEIWNAIWYLHFQSGNQPFIWSHNATFPYIAKWD